MAVTAAVRAIVNPTEKLEAQGQSIAGRLWDLLNMFRLVAVKSNSSLVYFLCLFANESEKLEEVKFKAECGPGDDAEPVITVMIPEEDDGNNIPAAWYVTGCSVKSYSFFVDC